MKFVTLVLAAAAIMLSFLMATDQAFTGAATFDIDTCVNQLIESGDLDVSKGTTSLSLNHKELMQLKQKCLN